jgi:DNA-binding NarL/FixJ family response regulator
VTPEPQRLILVVGHQPLVLAGLSAALAAMPRVRVVERLLADDLVVGMTPPDVVVLDADEAGEFRVEEIDRLKQLWPESRLIVVTSGDDPTAMSSALAHGAHAGLLRSEPIEAIQVAVGLVCSGTYVFSSTPTTATILQIGPKDGSSLATPAGRNLTPREVAVLQMVGRGFTDAEVADTWGISPRTVERHMSNVLNKLNCRNRAQAIAQVFGSTPPLFLAEQLEDVRESAGQSANQR